jgi:hypothetical protein
MEKILIKTGSASKDWNSQQKSKIKDILYSEKNPFYQMFNEERIYLDDVDGFISLPIRSYDAISSKLALKIAKYILKIIKFDGPTCIFVGNWAINVKDNKISI